ncbi:uncharacterized protein LOC134262263 [Saccostrea cucullata]|uniref:uncharacterized protein LOC134262263 n=1 Tax=Saccostrea cuccullata TaxID=36930 RepID=UPI002ED33166
MFTQPALERIWHEEPYSLNLEEEDGYYEDLYPDPLELKSDDSSIDLSMASSESEEEEENLAGIMSQLQEEEEMEFDLLRSQTLLENPVSADHSTASGSRPGTALQSTTNRPQSGTTRQEGGSDDPRPSSGSSRPESRPSSGSRPHSAILGPGLRQTSGTSPRGSRPSSGASTHSKHSIQSKHSVHSKHSVQSKQSSHSKWSANSKWSTSEPNKEGEGYINSGFEEEKPSTHEKPRKGEVPSMKKFGDAKIVAGRLRKKRTRKRDSEA